MWKCHSNKLESTNKVSIRVCFTPNTIINFLEYSILALSQYSCFIVISVAFQLYCVFLVGLLTKGAQWYTPVLSIIVSLDLGQCLTLSGYLQSECMTLSVTRILKNYTIEIWLLQVLRGREETPLDEHCYVYSYSLMSTEPFTDQ